MCCSGWRIVRQTLESTFGYERDHSGNTYEDGFPRIGDDRAVARSDPKCATGPAAANSAIGHCCDL
jgi:hypothetical protein